jgi:hypothetical protein
MWVRYKISSTFYFPQSWIFEDEISSQNKLSFVELNFISLSVKTKRGKHNQKCNHECFLPIKIVLVKNKTLQAFHVHIRSKPRDKTKSYEWKTKQPQKIHGKIIFTYTLSSYLLTRTKKTCLCFMSRHLVHYIYTR